jgi:hypothetical protein
MKAEDTNTVALPSRRMSNLRVAVATDGRADGSSTQAERDEIPDPPAGQTDPWPSIR